MDPAGNLLVADTYNHVIRRVTPSGEVTTIAGIMGQSGSADGPARQATFYGPGSVALDRAGNLYVADAGNYTIRRLSPDGLVVTLAGSALVSGYQDGSGASAKFGDCWKTLGCSSQGLAVDSQGNVYFADTMNAAIRRITPSGGVTTFVGSPYARGQADGIGTSASFAWPAGLSIDAQENLYLTDKHAVRKVSQAGVVTTLAGRVYEGGNADGSGDQARFFAASAIAVDKSGALYVADTGNNSVRKISPDGRVSTVAGQRNASSGTADGIGTAAYFFAPAGIALNASGQVYVSDTANSTIRRIDVDGRVSTFAGSPEVSEPRDGTAADARFGLPIGVVAAPEGNVYVADGDGFAIRQIAPDGTTSTFAGVLGQREVGNVDGFSRFGFPAGLAQGADGTLYVTDQRNVQIKKVSRSGAVSVLAGGQSGIVTDGPASTAVFSSPYGIAVDAAGNAYVADANAHSIRKVAADGTVTTIAGALYMWGTSDGPGLDARFHLPVDVAVDPQGNVYVADTLNHAIRKISVGGVVSTLAGMPGTPGASDGVGMEARFDQPIGIAVAPDGDLYVADSFNHTIRKVSASGRVTTVVGTAGLRGFRGDKLPGVLSFPWRVSVRGAELYVTMARGVVVVNPRP